MAQAWKHFYNVTFQFSNVRKMYSNILERIEWPEFPFRIMDIGCGSGRVLLEVLEPLLPKHYSGIVATDISEEMIDFCENLETDPRITFDVMSIETRDLPAKYRNNFDFLFSSFVLHYVSDLRQALMNCYNLLKPKGELVFIFLYEAHPLYEIYRKMYDMDEWKPYTGKFKNYVPQFTSENIQQELKETFQEYGLEIRDCQLNNDPYESAAENFLALFTSVDSIYSQIPDEKKEKYLVDFTNIFSRLAGFSLKEEDLRKSVQMYFPAIVVRAGKI